MAPNKAPASIRSFATESDARSKSSKMPSGVRKPKRSHAKKAQSIKSATTTTTTSDATSQASYLDRNEKRAIDCWNDAVQTKSTRSNAVVDEQDPVIQAYLAAKWSLFRNVAGSGDGSTSSNDSRSDSSSRS